MKKVAILLALAMIPMAMAEDVPPPPTDLKYLGAELNQIMEWFPGRFDNYLQTLEEEDRGAEKPLQRIHSIFTRVDLAQFGENVFYVEQYGDGDPTKIYRQRIYSWSVNEQEQAVELKIFKPNDAAALVGAHEDPEKLAGLTQEDVKSYPGCEVFWRRQDDHYIGYMKEKACAIVSSFGKTKGKTIYVTDRLYLDDDEIWIHDQAFLEDGTTVWGGDHPHKLKKANLYDCWGALAEDKQNPPEDGSGWQFIAGLKLHDQGGRALLKTGDGEPEYAVGLAQRTFKGARKYVDILKIELITVETDKVHRYSWAGPESTHVGMNLRWVQLGCTRAD